MHGYNVFFPIGFDAFGLPAENAAIKNGVHPLTWTMANIENMRRQFRTMGATFDWDNEVVTADPAYYRWNQWFFLRFLEAGLAYRAMAAVDWCPNDGTLAREQVEGADRHCWRCGAPVVKRDLAQWFFRTTAYADELLDFAGIDWPEPVRVMQTNWIGRSEGAEIDFEVAPDARSQPTAATTAPRLHDPPGHAVRRDVHGPGAGAPAGRPADPPGAARRGRRPTSSAPGARRRSSACRPSARRPASPSAPRRSTRSTASGSRSGSPTTCWPATARARSWPCPPTTSATSPSPRKFGLPIRRVVATPGVDADAPMEDAYVAHAADERLVNSGRFDGLSADEGGAAIVAWLAETGQGRAQGHLPPARLADQPPALLGHADPGHLLRARRHRARARRPAAGAAAGDRRLRRQRRQPAQPRRGVPAGRLPALRRAGPARDRHDGHVHRLVLVLVSLPVAGQGRRPGRPRDDRSLDAGRPVHRRRRARGHAPAVQPLLHQGDGRLRPGRRARAVQAPVQPGPDPGRGRRADVASRAATSRTPTSWSAATAPTPSACS